MTNDDHAVPVYHDRLHKAVLPDALCHVSHLRGVVLFGVGVIWRQLRQPSVFDSHKVTSCARFGHRHLRLCGTGGRAARTEEKGEEYFRGCPPRKTAAYSGIARRSSRPRAARHRADAEIAGMSWTPASSNKDERGVFSRGASIPPLRRQRRRRRRVLSLAIRMQLLVTTLADGLQLPGIAIVDGQC